MQTICPHCQTVFKVSDENLKAAEGYVRCGICKGVFNALETDLPKEELAAETKIASTAETPVEQVIESDSTDAVDLILEQSDEVSASEDISDKDETTTDSIENAQSDLFATPSETIKPEVIEPETAEPEVTEFEAAEPEAPEPESIESTETDDDSPDDITNNITEPAPEVIATTASTVTKPYTDKTESSSNSSNIDNSLFDGVQSRLIPDEYRIPELHNTYSIWRDVVWSLAILALTATLFVEYTWFNRNELISNPQLRPLVTEFCAIADCNLMGLREPGEIEMTTRNIYTHPNVKKALMISGTLVNHAQFEQPYPNILIDFSDVRGEVIASRTFTPKDYLQIKASSLKPMAPQVSIDFNMEIQDPGKQAMTYEFSFL